MQGALPRKPVGEQKDQHHSHYEAMAGMQRGRVARCGLRSIARAEPSDETAEEAVMSGVATRNGLRACAAFERANPSAAENSPEDKKGGEGENFQRVVILGFGEAQSTQKEQ